MLPVIERSYMTYYQFIQAVEMKVKERIKDNVTVSIHTAVKNNGTRRQGLNIVEQGINISPTIYLEEYYQHFQNGGTVEEIAGDILRLYAEVRFGRSFEGEYIKDYERVRRKIIYHLVNRESNQQMLRGAPYKRYLDLAVIFYVLLEATPYGTASMMIRNEHLSMWGVTQEDVYRWACRNTQRLLPDEFQTMRSVIEELTGIEEKGKEDSMYILSNNIRSYGAAAILYDGRLERIGEYLKENYYVLPSSVHEVIIVPESEAPGQAELSRLVGEINETQVEPEEVLSGNAYYYDRKQKKLLI